MVVCGALLGSELGESMRNVCELRCDGYQCDGSHLEHFEGEIIHIARQKNGRPIRVWVNQPTPHWNVRSDA